MTNNTLAQILYFIFLFFFGYFILLTSYYLFLCLIGMAEERKRSRQIEVEDLPLVYFSAFTMPVSIIIPARNEEEWIKDSVLSILNLNYPEFEVIVVDDGSTDKTSEVLNGVLGLKPVDVPYVRHYKDGQVHEILKSNTYPNVTVIRKRAGVKKAGAVNAGLNLAKYKYTCVIDADTVLEPDALLKVMAHIERDPDKIIGIGSYFGLSNGFKIKNGMIIERSPSYNPIVTYQHLEYARSFFGLRIGWSKYNSMPIVAGGFGVWRRDIVYELGGYSTEHTCEDLEFTFRAHDYIAKNRKKGYKIIMLPYYIGWTEGPSDITALILQRDRWQRVTNETIWKFKHMLFNPRYGLFGFLTVPYYLLYEVLGIFFELTSILIVAAAFLTMILDINIFFAYLLFMILSQAIISLLSILSFTQSRRLFTRRYILYMIALSFVELFWYKWLNSLAKLSGTCSYFRRNKHPDQYIRAKRI